MAKISFMKKCEGACPSFEDYYIGDRFAGRDYHGNLTYEYALFRRLPFVVTKRFGDQAEAAREYFTKLVLNSRIPVNSNGDLVAICNNTIIKLDLKTNEISERPYENEQLSAWHQTYAQCVAEAKQIIAKRQEDERNAAFARDIARIITESKDY